MGFFVDGLSFVILRFPTTKINKPLNTTAIVMVMNFLNAFPFSLKPIWGFMSDESPMFGYRFKSYILLCVGVQLIMSLALTFGRVKSYFVIFILTSIMNVANSINSCLVEGVVTIATKIDSRVRFPDFVKKSDVFLPNSYRYVGTYKLLVFISRNLFFFLDIFFNFNKILSNEVIYATNCCFYAISAFFIVCYFEEKKVGYSKTL